MQMTGAVDRRRTISGLHYIRALATISVVMVHCVYSAALPKYFGHQVLGTFFEPSGGEIDLFFIMSGVIMVIATHDASTRLPRVTLGAFLIRRALRIMPMLWLAVLAYDAAFMLGRSSEVDALASLRAMFLVPVGTVVPFVAWTIRYEALFYLIFGICFLFDRRLIPLAVAWFVSPLLLGVVHGTSTAEDGTLLHFFFSPFALEFGTGVAIGFLHLRFSMTPIPLRHQLPVIILLMAGMRASIWYAGPSLVFATTPFVLVLLPCLIVLMIVALRTDPPTMFLPLVFLGDASYSIFLFHPPVVSAVMGGLARFAWAVPTGLAVALACVLSVTVGGLIHVLIEKPLVKYANLRLHTLPRAVQLRVRPGTHDRRAKRLTRIMTDAA